MKVLISGGNGMIGTALTKALLSKGHHVWILTRAIHAAQLAPGVQAVRWDGQTSAGWGELAGEVEAVVNLAGERLSKWPWTENLKQRFWNSRVDAGHALVESIRESAVRPQVFIQASGVNYYGPRTMAQITEQDLPGQDFLARLCIEWENSTQPVEEMGVRRVVIRSAIVLSAQDGILPIMMLPVRAFAGGALGTGKQGLAWIHLEDEVAAILFLLENPNARGPFNLTAPGPISSAEFIRALARSLHRPYWLPAPAFALKLILGEMATLILDGAYIVPQRLIDLGFGFRYGNVHAALSSLLGN